MSLKLGAGKEDLWSDTGLTKNDCFFHNCDLNTNIQEICSCRSLDVTLERDNLAKWSFPSHSRCCPKYRRRKAATVTMATNSSPVLTRNRKWISIFNANTLSPLWSFFSALICAKKIKQTNFFFRHELYLAQIHQNISPSLEKNRQCRKSLFGYAFLNSCGKKQVLQIRAVALKETVFPFPLCHCVNKREKDILATW